MTNSYFRFKQFIVHQDHCAMKVGTDGVLLGAWSNVVEARNVLDVGTGTGLLSLMIAQRSQADIVAIEIEKGAVMQAIDNVNNSPWKERIEVRHCSLQEFVKKFDYKFDYIISNPPFFRSSLKSPDSERAMARHTDSLSYEDLIASFSKLLDKKGMCSVILPFPEKDLFLGLSESKGLFPIRMVTIYPTPTSVPKRVLIEFSFCGGECEYRDLVIEDNGRHQYSEEYKKLTRDFYL